MTIEWIHGMVEVTYPLENKLSDEDCVDAQTLGEILACLDGAHALSAELTSLFVAAGLVKSPAPEDESSSRSSRASASAAGNAGADTVGGSSSDCSTGPQSRAQAAETLQEALAAGAQLNDVVPDASADARSSVMSSGGALLAAWCSPILHRQERL